MRTERKQSKIKTGLCLRVYLILVSDTRQQPGETQDPLTPISWTAKKVRANETSHEHRTLQESIQGEASVSIYILALALSRVLSARVYSRHKDYRSNFGNKSGKFTSRTNCPWTGNYSHVLTEIGANKLIPFFSIEFPDEKHGPILSTLKVQKKKY